MTSVQRLGQLIVNDPGVCDQACNSRRQGFIFSHMITQALELLYKL